MIGSVDVILVPTTHWDREWYRTFQAFRARLVDTVDRVLELLDADPGYTFLLDGQSIVLEDYLEIRPGRRGELERGIRDGRVEIGPWYVQPDSFLPSGEAHVRNLLEGRRAGEAFGPVSRVAYTPDSFGHPAQFPQLFSGFGLEHFVYWRGNADEIAELGAEYAWTAPDGSVVCACHLWKTYSNAAGLPRDTEAAVAQVKETVSELAARTNTERVLLLAGTDHQPPEARTKEVCEALAAATGWKVRRGLLRDFVDGLDADGRPAFRGELAGGRVANLLPGVWSTRTYLKLRNRRCETLLEGWAEPWAALGRVLGAPDERPGLHSAWRQLLCNQAHDSICGCSQDAVHEQMLGRYDYASELGRETTARACERIAGLGTERRAPWSDEVDLAVFNPSPHPRTDVVRFPLHGYPPFDQSHRRQIHPLVWANLRPLGFDVAQDAPEGAPSEGRPARLVPVGTNDRVRLIPDQEDWEVEFVCTDVPAFGWKRVHLRPSDRVEDDEDDGREISAGNVTVRAGDDGRLSVRFADREYTGLCDLEDTGDRGDTYDFDPVSWDAHTECVQARRRRHAGGIEHLEVRRVVDVPTLQQDRSAPDPGPTHPVEVTCEARVAPGVDRVDLRVRVRNTARDHRLRLLFPTGAPADRFLAATTFDVCERTTAKPDDSGWIHPAPTTFPCQGWVSAGGLTVVAPGLYEAEVKPDGVIAVTLVRAVGALSRPDLRTRPGPAGPGLVTPGAQCLRTFEAHLSLFAGTDPRAARDAELGLLAVVAGDTPLCADGAPLVSIEPRELVLSALKPAEHSDGLVLRVLNPTDDAQEAAVALGFDASSASAVRLDESEVDERVGLAGRTLRFTVAARALRSVLLS